MSGASSPARAAAPREGEKKRPAQARLPGLVPDPGRAQSDDSLRLATTASPLRRKCASCGASLPDDEPIAAGPVLRRCAACEAALSEGRPAPGGCSCDTGRAADGVAGALAGGGRALDPATRAFFEARFGRGLGAVRVHDGPRADASARAVDALAYTVGSDVVFRAGRYAPGTREGRRLLAHELAHTVQQGTGGGARVAAHPAAPVAVGRADDPLEREADRAAEAVLAPGPARPPALSPDRGSAVRRAGVLDTLGGAWDATGGRVVSAAGRGAEWVGERAGDAWDAAAEGAASLAGAVAPELVRFLRGDVVGMIRERILAGLGAFLGGVAGRVRREGLAAALRGLVGEAAGALGGFTAELRAGGCRALEGAAATVAGLVRSIGEPLVEMVRGAASSAGDFLTMLWERLASPALEAVRYLAGSAWEWMESTALYLWELTEPVRSGLAAAWSILKEQLGIAWDTAGGVLEWLKEKAAAAWESVLETLRPALGPLKVVGAVLLLLSPLGPVAALGYGAARLWEALAWLRENWSDLRIVVEARELLHGTILPALTAGIELLRGALSTAVTWLSWIVGEVAGAAGALLDALTSPLLAGLRFLASGIAGMAAELGDFVDALLRPVVDELLATLDAMWELVRPTAEVVGNLAIIAASPWMWPLMLAGRAWLRLPECLKAPVLDWVLAVMVRALEALPDFHGLGEWWPQARGKLLDVLREASAMPLERKMEVAERVAEMMAGGQVAWVLDMLRAAAQAPALLEGQVEEELIGMDLTQPLPFERTAAPAPAHLAAALAEGGGVGPEDLSVLARPHLTEDDMEVDSVGWLDVEPELLEQVPDGGEVEFGDNPDPAASIDAIRAELAGGPAAAGEEGAGGEPLPPASAEAAAAAPEDTEAQLQAMMAQPGPESCEPPAPGGAAQGAEIPEHMKIGPLTRGQRGRYLASQMWKGIRHWLGCNLWWLVPSLAAAVLGLIALELLSGGWVTAALPVIFEVLGLVMIGVSVLRGVYHVGAYLAKAIAGDVAGAARSLARAVAIVVVEVAFAALFSIAAIFQSVRAVLRGAGAAARRTAGGAARAATRTLKAGERVLGSAGRAVGSGVRRTAGATLRRGKIVMQGVGDSIGTGMRTLDDLARGLWQRVRFRRFKLRRTGWYLQLWGYINPWLMMANGRVRRQSFAGAGKRRPQLGQRVRVTVRGKQREALVVGVRTNPSGYVDELKKAGPSGAQTEFKKLYKLPEAKRASRMGHSEGTDKLRLGIPGPAAPPLYQAHHIAPRELKKTFQKFWDEIGFDVENGAFNGVMLPPDPLLRQGHWINASVHWGYHRKYSVRMTTRIDVIRTAYVTGKAGIPAGNATALAALKTQVLNDLHALLTRTRADLLAGAELLD